MPVSVLGLPLNRNTKSKCPSLTTFTSSGTWRKPPGCTWIKVTLSGGGSGAYGSQIDPCASTTNGNCGAVGTLWLDVTNINDVAVTIGSGSSGGAGASPGNCYVASPSSAGGASSFGSYMTCNGGNASGSGTPASSTGSNWPIPGYLNTRNSYFGYAGYGAGGAYPGGTGVNGVCYVEEYYS